MQRSSEKGAWARRTWLTLGLGLALPAARAGSAPAPWGPAVLRLREWVLASGDHRQRPFLIVDKPAARLALFSGQGALLGAAPVLLGLARGDATLPGVGDKPVTALRPEEQTTPAGRFPTEPGRNLEGEDIVWLDYGAGLALHRLRPGRDRAAREQRLATPTPADNRASAGCVVVLPAFYDEAVRPTLGTRRGMAYVLPEQGPLERWFPGLAGV